MKVDPGLPKSVGTKNRVKAALTPPLSTFRNEDITGFHDVVSIIPFAAYMDWIQDVGLFIFLAVQNE